MKKLSIVIPVYNEEKTIKEILTRVIRQDVIGLEKEVIIVDDGSRDRTKGIIKEFVQQHPKESVVFFSITQNRGKGAAVRKGLQKATGDIILIQDADLEYYPSEYPKLLKPILDGEASVIYGSRLLGHHIDMYWLHVIGNRFLNYLTNILYGSKLTDLETCYKVFKGEVIKGMKLRANGFNFEPEITAKIIKKGYKIKEVPLKFDDPRSFEEGKKINLTDGFKAAYCLIKYRFFD